MTDDLISELKVLFSALFRHAENKPDLMAAIENGATALGEGGLSWARLNQIMHLCSWAGMSEGFYKYYFLKRPESHPYDIHRNFPHFSPPEDVREIQSFRHFKWGIERFMVDAMLFKGNFHHAYESLRRKECDELENYFASKRINEGRMVNRGDVLEPYPIGRDSRYLISEMAADAYSSAKKTEEAEHVKRILEAFDELQAEGGSVTWERLRERARHKAEANQQLGLFDLLFETKSGPVSGYGEIIAVYRGQNDAFLQARETALKNTRIYLSMCSDLDVYVATSMRTRDDFREMVDYCERIFKDERLAKYHPRYFDPTLSASKYHEDKGVIECLMVKTCKVLLYFAQHKESLGKVSELAMALSLGKPVIVLCPSDAKGTEIFKFYSRKHPLLRLVEFKTGLVNGAMITQAEKTVVDLLERIFSNKTEYRVEKRDGTEGYYLLKEQLTGSTVRIITDDSLLTETFWNNYLESLDKHKVCHQT